MRKPATLILAAMTMLLQLPLLAENEDLRSSDLPETSETPTQLEKGETPPQPVVPPQTSMAPFKAFTGKVTKNRVRLRLQPNLDGPILRELKSGDLLVIVGETDDFYAVQPPADTKAYVFRTYVLDNVVEANRVNVRLQPDVDAPVIAQLTTGDRIQGSVSSANNKWLEITPPASARFYVAKDYVENIGDPALMSTIERRREEVNMLLNSAYLVSQTEMQKTFPDINLDAVFANLNKVVHDYSDFSDQSARAREMTTQLQDSYLKKKLTYLESKSMATQSEWQNKNAELNAQVKNQQQKLSRLEQQLQKGGKTAQKVNPGLSSKMAAWLPVEQSFYEQWAAQNNNRSQEEFYLQQREEAIALNGMIEPYSRIIKNKPGDYVIVNQSSNLPIAYLYSTQVNLQDVVGHNVTVHVTPRPNNNFAFPAYFVLWLE